MRIMMVVASAVSYLPGFNNDRGQGKYGNADQMNFEHPLTILVWLTSIVSVVLTFVVSSHADHSPPRWRRHDVVEAVVDHHLRHAGRRHHPRGHQDLHLDELGPRARVVTSSREGGASLNVCRV